MQQIVEDSVDSLYMSFSEGQITLERLPNKGSRLTITYNGQNTVLVYSPDLIGHEALWRDRFHIYRTGTLVAPFRSGDVAVKFTPAAKALLIEKMKEFGAEVPLF